MIPSDHLTRGVSIPVVDHHLHDTELDHHHTITIHGIKKSVIHHHEVIEMRTCTKVDIPVHHIMDLMLHRILENATIVLHGMHHDTEITHTRLIDMITGNMIIVVKAFHVIETLLP